MKLIMMKLIETIQIFSLLAFAPFHVMIVSFEFKFNKMVATFTVGITAEFSGQGRRNSDISDTISEFFYVCRSNSDRALRNKTHLIRRISSEV